MWALSTEVLITSLVPAKKNVRVCTDCIWKDERRQPTGSRCVVATHKSWSFRLFISIEPPPPPPPSLAKLRLRHACFRCLDWNWFILINCAATIQITWSLYLASSVRKLEINPTDSRFFVLSISSEPNILLSLAHVSVPPSLWAFERRYIYAWGASARSNSSLTSERANAPSPDLWLLFWSALLADSNARARFAKRLVILISVQLRLTRSPCHSSLAL